MPTTSVLFALFGLFTTGSAMATCVASDPATKYCTDSDGYIGNCNNTDTTCVVTKPCDAKNANEACGKLEAGADGMFKGKCDSSGTKCKFTTMCSSGDTNTKICYDSGYIGTCNGATCQVATHCQGKTKDSACGDLAGSVPMLKGKCEDDNTKCMFTTMCATGDTNTKYCNDSSGYIGKCNGATCEVNTQCKDMAINLACGYLDGSAAMLKGKCKTAGGKCEHTTACSSGDTAKKYCKDGDYIGKCKVDGANTTCDTAAACQGQAKNENCGNVGGHVAMLEGRCEDVDAKCKYTKTVHIDYTILASDTTKDAVQTELEKTTFPTNLASDLGRPVIDFGLFCADVTPTVPNGTLNCPAFSRAPCSLTCSGSTYSVQEPPTRRCDKTGAWVGEVGKCESKCPETNFTAVDGKYEMSTGVSNGKLVCDSLFNGAGCKLVCTNPVLQNPKPDTTYKCEYNSSTGATAWTGNKGGCEETTEFSASAEVRLNPSDNYATIVAKTDTTFNDAFRTAVAARISGISMSEVVIVNIKAPAGGGRRLNEPSVVVDYTVLRVGKGDPEGATSVEGGLRGIR